MTFAIFEAKMTIWTILSVLIASITLSLNFAHLNPFVIGHWLALVSCVSLFSICLTDRVYRSSELLRAFIALHFIAIFLFVLGTLSLQIASIVLRLLAT